MGNSNSVQQAAEAAHKVREFIDRVRGSDELDISPIDWVKVGLMLLFACGAAAELYRRVFRQSKAFMAMARRKPNADAMSVMQLENALKMDSGWTKAEGSCTAAFGLALLIAMFFLA